MAEVGKAMPVDVTPVHYVGEDIDEVGGIVVVGICRYRLLAPVRPRMTTRLGWLFLCRVLIKIVGPPLHHLSALR